MNKFSKRLIEVALPIMEISFESQRDKSIRQGHISTLHLWWARRPLPTARAVTFASLIYDPDDINSPINYRKQIELLLKNNINPILKSYTFKNKNFRDDDPYKPYAGVNDTLRNRLLMFIGKWSAPMIKYLNEESNEKPDISDTIDDRSLIKWETTDPKNSQGIEILKIARNLIQLCNPEENINVLDPFAGGGAIPLEVSRLGCTPYANDYNPVAYTILRATCEFPQKYGKAGFKNIISKDGQQELIAQNKPIVNILSQDIREWTKWILDKSELALTKYYPKGTDNQKVIGYLWARTVKCANPSCNSTIPLIRSFKIADLRNGRKTIGIEPIIQNRSIQFKIIRDKNHIKSQGTMRDRGNALCPVCNQLTPVEYIRQQGLKNEIGEQLLSVIIDTQHGKDYRNVEDTDISAYLEAQKESKKYDSPIELILPEITKTKSNISNSTGIRVHLYGMDTWGSLFNDRQKLSINTCIKYLNLSKNEIFSKYKDKDYCNALIIYLSLFINRILQRGSSVGLWHTGQETFEHPFGRQAIPMVWDYPEANIFSKFVQKTVASEYMTEFIDHESPFSLPRIPAIVTCSDGANIYYDEKFSAIVTDPPYFDAIAYADLSDFFYVWMKKSLSDILPNTFSTPLTPKSNEATSLKHRHSGDSVKADMHFSLKLSEILIKSRKLLKDNGVISIMFAHQSVKAWDALIKAVLNADLNIVSTWPIDTEKTYALKNDKSVLSSSITVTCKPRNAINVVSLKDIRAEIQTVIKNSIKTFWDSGIRGADLIVACYGPAVSVFGKYLKVEKADGTEVNTEELLQLARNLALESIAGELNSDNESKLYYVWASLYGILQQEWDDARLIVQIGGDPTSVLNDAKRQGIFVVDGQKCRLALLQDRKGNFGNSENPSLIDSLHRAMKLWQEEKRDNLAQYLQQKGLFNDESVWKLAQALFEVLPKNTIDRKLISSLLTERKSLETVARNLDKNTVIQQQLSI